MVINLGRYAGVKKGIENITLYQLLECDMCPPEPEPVKPLATVHMIKPAKRKYNEAKYVSNRLALAIAIKARGYALRSYESPSRIDLFT